MEKIEILWTGGFDSTFRVCQLSRKEVEIQPYYLSDKRQSEKNELNAIKVITEKLRANKQTKATICDLIYVDYNERSNNEEISKSYKKLREKDFMGGQYEWLATFALEHKGIEMSIHKDDKAILLIEKNGKLNKICDDKIGEYYVLDKEGSSKELFDVFRNISYPLTKYTKLEMKQELIDMGLEDVINDTWFCHTPIHNKPCGCCNPCIYTIEEGMPERFDSSALRRYKMATNKIIGPSYNFYRRIKKKISSI